MTVYAYTTEPPVGRLLIVIREHCGVGGTIRPGNRQLADWLGYASAGHIHHLLDQLACDGRILYDRDTRLITLLADPDEESIPLRDQHLDEADDSGAIPQRDQGPPIDPSEGSIPDRDRVFRHQDAEEKVIPSRDQLDPRMEDHVLATTSSRHDSVAVSYKLPCSPELIPQRDHPAAQIMAELGAEPAVIADAFSCRPDWTPQQIRDRWAYDQERIETSGGKLTTGVFYHALRRGQLAPSRREQSVDWSAYATPDPEREPAESLRDHALRITPEDISGRDFQYVLSLLAEGLSDEAVLGMLELRRLPSWKRGAP